MDMATPHIETSTINKNRTENTRRAIRMLTRENRESATYDVNQRACGRTPKKTETSHDNTEQTVARIPSLKKQDGGKGGEPS